MELVEVCDPAKMDEVIILKCEISLFEKNRGLGILNNEQESVEIRRLAYRILRIAKAICLIRN
jgi:hypothetical protein